MVSTVEETKKRDAKKLLAVIGAPDHIMDFYNNALACATDNSVEYSDSDHEYTPVLLSISVVKIPGTQRFQQPRIL